MQKKVCIYIKDLIRRKKPSCLPLLRYTIHSLMYIFTLKLYLSICDVKMVTSSSKRKLMSSTDRFAHYISQEVAYNGCNQLVIILQYQQYYHLNLQCLESLHLSYFSGFLRQLLQQPFEQNNSDLRKHTVRISSYNFFITALGTPIYQLDYQLRTSYFRFKTR